MSEGLFKNKKKAAVKPLSVHSEPTQSKVLFRLGRELIVEPKKVRPIDCGLSYAKAFASAVERKVKSNSIQRIFLLRVSKLFPEVFTKKKAPVAVMQKYVGELSFWIKTACANARSIGGRVEIINDWRHDQDAIIALACLHYQISSFHSSPIILSMSELHKQGFDNIQVVQACTNMQAFNVCMDDPDADLSQHLTWCIFNNVRFVADVIKYDYKRWLAKDRERLSRSVNSLLICKTASIVTEETLVRKVKWATVCNTVFEAPNEQRIKR